MIGGDRIAEHAQGARTGDGTNSRRRQRHPVEERRVLDVRRIRIPGVKIALLLRQASPVVVAMEHVRVLRLEHLGLDRAQNLFFDLLRAGPDVAQEHWAVLAHAERLGTEVDVHATRQRVGNDERRRAQIVEARQRIDASLEIAITRKHRRDDELVCFDRFGDRHRQWPRVADAGGAAKSHDVETELLQRAHHAGLLEVIRHHLGAGSQARFDPRLRRKSLGDGVSRQKSGRQHHAWIRGVGAAGDRGDHDGAVAN